MTVHAIVSDLLAMMGLGVASSCATESLKTALVNRLNEGVQIIHSSPKAEFQTTENLDLTLTDGQANYTLDASVAKVIGPIYWQDTGVILARAQTLGEFLSQAALFSGQQSEVRPALAFVETRRSVAAGEATATTLRLSPTPDESRYSTLKMIVVKAPTRYTLANVAEAESPEVPMAHTWVESILLPIVRYLCLSIPAFGGDSRVQSMAQHYRERFDAALVQLGLANPNETEASATARQSETR